MADLNDGKPALEDNELTKDGILDILNDNDNLDDNPDKDDILDDSSDSKKSKEKKSNEEDEEEVEKKSKKGKEDEEEIELEDKEDDIEFKEIPRRQEILKQFPELFKKFPGIEHAIYREQRYAEVFPTIADAKTAQENSAQFEKFESGILSGSLTDVLKAAKQADEEAFGRITETLLPTLRDLDSAAYGTVLSQVLKSASITMWQKGKQLGDNDEGNNLRAAAQILHEFAFNDKQITPFKGKYDGKLAEKDDPEKKKFSEERETFFKQQLDVAVNDVTSRVKNLTKSTVEKYIDPKGVMSGYVKSKAIEDILSKVDEGVLGDDRFKKILDKHWQNSAGENFSESSKQRIRNTLLSKIKTILPDIIKGVKAEALRDSKSRLVNDDKDDEVKDEKPISRGRETSNRPTNRNESRNDRGKNDGRGMSTYDFFGKD